MAAKNRLELYAEVQGVFQNSKLGVLNAKVDINNDSINVINANQQLKNSKRDLNVVLGNSLIGPRKNIDWERRPFRI